MESVRGLIRGLISVGDVHVVVAIARVTTYINSYMVNFQSTKLGECSALWGEPSRELQFARDYFSAQFGNDNFGVDVVL